MKNVKLVLRIFLTIFIISCNKDLNDDVDFALNNKDFEIHKLETEYDFNSFSEPDQLKITMTESLENLLISDKEYARDFLKELVVDNNVQYNQTKIFV